MNNFTKLFLVAAALFCTAAQAQSECDKYKTSYDKTYCFAKLFLESDKELNLVYGELQKQLKEPARKQLTGVQRDWIKHRDATCERSGAIDVDCNYRVNRDRAEYLRDRARECKTGTCRDEMISKKSWG
jgi:uncharacterized protein YecT (DUF1311 family)